MKLFDLIQKLHTISDQHGNIQLIVAANESSNEYHDPVFGKDLIQIEVIHVPPSGPCICFLHIESDASYTPKSKPEE